MTSIEYFKEFKYVVVRNFISEDIMPLYYEYCITQVKSIDYKITYCKKEHNEEWDGRFTDPQSPGNFSKYGDFSRLNRNWNVASSSILHKRLSKDNEEWVHYHQLYREAREKWPVTPYLEIIKRYKNRNSLVIGDFGCGEAFIHKELNIKNH